MTCGKGRSRGLTDRDLAAHFAVIRSRGCCLYGLPVRDVFGPVPQWCFLDSLLHDIEGAEDRITGEAMYLILNLARVLGWLRERRILSKTEGGEWGLKNIPAKYGPPLRVALREYREGTDERYDPEALRRYAAYMMDQIRQLAQDLGDEGPELASAADAGTVAGLACMLWPEHTQEELEAEFEALLENKDAAVFLYRKQGKVVGFCLLCIHRVIHVLYLGFIQAAEHYRIAHGIPDPVHAVLPPFGQYHEAVHRNPFTVYPHIDRGRITQALRRFLVHKIRFGCG